MKNKDPIEISVVIPVYNEEANLHPLTDRLVAEMKSINKHYEIIFVDDGSEDGSSKVLKEIRNSQAFVRVLTLDRNHGQTAAFDAGFNSAKGEVIITLDSDLQNDPADIPALLEKIGDYDMVAGYRHKRQDSWLKLVSSKIANFVRNKLSDETIRDVGCSLKAYRRSCLEKIKLYHGMHRFLPTLFKMEGFTVVEVKVRHLPRLRGKSKYNIRNRVFRSFADLLAVRWMKKRLITYKVKEE